MCLLLLLIVPGFHCCVCFSNVSPISPIQVKLTKAAHDKLMKDVTLKINEAVGSWGNYFMQQLRVPPHAPSAQDTSAARPRDRCHISSLGRRDRWLGRMSSLCAILIGRRSDVV